MNKKCYEALVVKFMTDMEYDLTWFEYKISFSDPSYFSNINGYFKQLVEGHIEFLNECQ